MLLPPRKHAMLDRLYRWYGRRLLRTGFARVWVGGTGVGSDPTRPLVVAANHSAWWDPIVALFISHEPFRREAYGIMEGAQLLRYPFFRRVGGFGVTTTEPADARALAELATTVLTERRGRVLWVFPQGALLPRGAPLRFHAGVARIARRCPDAGVVPVAIRYEFGREQRAECFVRIGAPLDASGPAKALTRELEDRVAGELRTLDADLAADRRAGYRVALEGRVSLGGRQPALGSRHSAGR
jgi:1-acyl-sn-glycerol-3-phosphate acyltransferase